MTGHNIVSPKVFGKRYLGVGYGALRILPTPRRSGGWPVVAGWTAVTLASAMAGMVLLENLFRHGPR